VGELTLGLKREKKDWAAQVSSLKTIYRQHLGDLSETLLLPI
jgi:hypothetical protein